MSRMRADRVAGATCLLLSTAASLEATRFEVGFLTDPVGPKALPLLSCALLAVGGAELLARPASGAAWPIPAVRLRIAAATATMLVYPLLLRPLGFFLATALAVGALTLLFGARPRYGVLAGAALSGALYLLFAYALALPLPVGELFFPD